MNISYAIFEMVDLLTYVATAQANFVDETIRKQAPFHMVKFIIHALCIRAWIG